MAQQPHSNDIAELEGGMPSAPREWFKGAGVVILEFVKIAVLAAITIGAVRYFVFKPFIVHGASMVPNFYENEYLIIDEISYRFKEPQRGDIVVTRNPDKNDEFFLKRVIGLPGEHLIVNDGKVRIATDKNPDGATLEENYLPSREFTPGSVDITLGLDELYVMGDNRDASLDSRVFGPLKRSLVVGKVLLRGWPFDRAQRFSVPEYNI